MAIMQDTGSTETTIAQVASSLKSDVLQLQGELEEFLHQPQCEQKLQSTPPFADPIVETVAVLQDCRKLILDIRHLAIDRIAKRILS